MGVGVEGGGGCLCWLYGYFIWGMGCRNHHELLLGQQDKPRGNSVSRSGLLLDSRVVGRLAAQVQL